MTIALGFKCSNGVVIATDSQYSLDISKTRGQKIFPIPTNGYYAVTIGGAGSSNMIKSSVATIERSLSDRVGTRPTTTLEIRGIIEEVLQRSFAEHVDPAPADERRWLDYSLLIAIWTPKERSLLFNTQRDVVIEVGNPNHFSSGIGSYLAEFVLHALFDRTWMLSLDEATTVSAYIVTMAKEFVEGCGGSTFVRALDDSGHDIRLGPDEVRNATEYYEELFRWTSSIRSHLSSALDPASVDMVPYASILKDQIINFRTLQDKRRAFSNELIAKHGIRPKD
jgi:20S proteasome alpha/beta subunit